jgi:hypothetical protein
MANVCRYSISATKTLAQEVMFEKWLLKLRQQGKKDSELIIATFEVGTTGADTATEIIVGYTNAFSAIDTTTLHILSSDAKDTAAGVGAQAVTIDYIKAGVITSKEFEMAGTSHSHINDGTWDRIIGMRVTRVGTEGDPAGNIVLDVHATGTVYCTIPAASNYSITSKMWLSTLYNGTPVSVCCSTAYTAAATADFKVIGTNLDIDMNGSVITKGVPVYAQDRELLVCPPIAITGDKYMSLKQQSWDTTLNQEMSACVTYLIWTV